MKHLRAEQGQERQLLNQLPAIRAGFVDPRRGCGCWTTATALLFIRGERAVRDEKYDILRHPNVKLTVDGGGRALPAWYGGERNGLADCIA